MSKGDTNKAGNHCLSTKEKEVVVVWECVRRRDGDKHPNH